MIVLLDSGIWISALGFGGTPQFAVFKALTIDSFVVCDQIKEEINRVLVEKLDWESQRAEESLSFYFQDAIWVPVPGNLHGVCRDPKDDMIIECAVNGNADVIVSGDKDLLTIGNYGHIRIITAREYIS